MAPDASRWQAPGAYAYLDALIASDLAWECLRRNPAYQDDYHAHADDPALAGHFALHWGLRFPS
jgi:hypothetical protein